LRLDLPPVRIGWSKVHYTRPMSADCSVNASRPTESGDLGDVVLDHWRWQPFNTRDGEVL